MSIERILFLLIGQHAVGAICAYWTLRDTRFEPVEKEMSLKGMVGKYWIYCRPLILLSMAGFLYGFADKWMLQRFGGASQQGYFQVASQFASVSLLATTSILSIFWKEIADASAKRDHSRIADLYRKATRALVMLGAIFSGFLLPWSEEIVAIVLGQAYAQSWPVLAIMLIYPIHQAMGQIGGTMFLASGQTQRFMVISLFIMFGSIPFSYFALAPSSGILIPGLGLGAIGLASKMVLVNVVSVNLQAWVIARYGGWRFDWQFQMVGIPLMFAFGFLAKILVWLLWDLKSRSIGDLIIPGVFAGVVYVISVAIAIWMLPWLIGAEKRELLNLFRRLRTRFG